MVQKDLANTLREIGAKGSAAFYQGPIAEKFAAYMKAQGGLIDQKDLAAIRANEDPAIKINYKGIDVYECPPNSQGFVMLQALNILEGMNVRYMRHNSAPYLHAVTESLKLAFADRNKYVADPKFTPNIPMRQMLSKEYAAMRRALDRSGQGDRRRGAVRQSHPADRSAALRRASRGWRMRVRSRRRTTVITGEENGHTTYLAVVDKDRNMVSVTSSLLSLFGSGHVVEGAGFMLNNRMAYYGLDEDDVNVLRPGKRVRQTINPALALKDGKPYMVFGTPGADTQPQAQMQFFLNVAEFGMNVQQALEQDYIVSTSFKSSYYPHAAEGKLQVPATIAEARARRARGDGPQARHPQRARRRLGEGDRHSSAHRRVDGRRQPDARQLRDGVLKVPGASCLVPRAGAKCRVHSHRCHRVAAFSRVRTRSRTGRPAHVRRARPRGRRRSSTELTAAVNADRSDAARWGRLAMGLEANGLLVQAAANYEVAVGLDGSEPRWRYQLALLKARRGEVDAALADLDRVVQLAPGYAPARWKQGLWWLDRGDTAKAQAAFRSGREGRAERIPPATPVWRSFTCRSARTRRLPPRLKHCSPLIRAIVTRCNCWARPTGVSAANRMRALPSPSVRPDNRRGPIPGPTRSASTGAASPRC